MKAALIGFAFLGVIVMLVIFGFLFAYPTMWIVNWLFASTFLKFVFGTSTLTIWQAWALTEFYLAHILSGFLFKSTSTKS